MTAILGISAFYHDSAAAIIVDGEIIAAAQEERFTRIKHDSSFPAHAIEYCLREAQLTPEQIDFVGFYEKPFLKFERLLETTLAFAPFGFKAFLNTIPSWLKTKLHIPKIIYEGLQQKYKKRIIFVEHHESHAASAFFPSPFKEAAFLTVDGVGEWATASYGTGVGNRIEIKKNSIFHIRLACCILRLLFTVDFESILVSISSWAWPPTVSRVLPISFDKNWSTLNRTDQYG